MAFISNEILIKEISGYAGGLGILSGGLLSSARDLGYPMLGITFVNKGGYVQHKIENGKVVDYEDPYDPDDYFRKLKRTFSIELKGKKIYFRLWEDKLSEDVKIYFIDTDVEDNDEFIKKLTYRLYVDGSEEQKILRRFLLALGTLKIIDSLTIPIKKFHLNESHCGFIALELYKRYLDEDKVREKIVFTTHTPLPHGHEKFPYSLVEKYYDVPSEIKEKFPNELNMSRILHYFSSYRNCVSWKHRETLRRQNFIGFDYITNGVHTKWVEEEMRNLYDRYIPGWFYNPKKFIDAGSIPLKELGKAKSETKEQLLNFINENAYLNKEFDKEGILVVIRRRITRYKRNDMFLWNVEKIEELGKRYGLQFYVSGTTHPYDVEGKGMIMNLLDKASTLNNVKIALHFKNGKKYERIAIAGGDLFLHTSIPPLEACGTSWMRAAFNAVPSISSKDGGIIEVLIDGYNGWLFGKNRFNAKWDESSDEFFKKFEEVLSISKEEYLEISRNALKTIAPMFSTNRALKEYINRAYE